jgi:hypothetical protein
MQIADEDKFVTQRTLLVLALASGPLYSIIAIRQEVGKKIVFGPEPQRESLE